MIAVKEMRRLRVCAILKETFIYGLQQGLKQWFLTFYGLWPPSRDSQHQWRPAQR